MVELGRTVNPAHYFVNQLINTKTRLGSKAAKASSVSIVPLSFRYPSLMTSARTRAMMTRATSRLMRI